MKAITKSQLKSKAKTSALHESVSFRLSESRTESQYGKKTVFLSHKHNEKEELANTIDLLKSFGVQVYVDWLDEGMPKSTSGTTAKKIKKRIKENRKFVLLATEEAIASKWCNWELGLGDAAKYIDHIAVLPVADDNREFSGAEYLQIYPYIESNQSIYNEKWDVVFPDGRRTSIANWLNS